MFDNPALPSFVDIDDCQPSKISSQGQDLCYPGVECRDRKAPRRGFDCGKCPKGYVGNGKICQKEGKRKVLSIQHKIAWMLYSMNVTSWNYIITFIFHLWWCW